MYISEKDMLISILCNACLIVTFIILVIDAHRK